MNVTLSIPEDVVKQARRYAEKHGTSLNQMIREHLSGLTHSTEREQKVAQAMAFFRRLPPTLPTNTKIPREEMERR